MIILLLNFLSLSAPSLFSSLTHVRTHAHTHTHTHYLCLSFTSTLSLTFVLFHLFSFFLPFCFFEFFGKKMFREDREKFLRIVHTTVQKSLGFLWFYIWLCMYVCIVLYCIAYMYVLYCIVYMYVNMYCIVLCICMCVYALSLQILVGVACEENWCYCLEAKWQCLRARNCCDGLVFYICESLFIQHFICILYMFMYISRY